MKIPTNRTKLSRSILPNGLGTLQVLPYEIRQHIFMIVLVDYIDKHYKAVYDKSINKLQYLDDDFPQKLQLRFQRKGNGCCCMLGNQKPAFAGVFHLASYCQFQWKLESGSLNIRSASHSIQAEFDCMFLTRSTFAFDCPAALRVFLSHLTPLQQGQLRRLKLRMFRNWWYSRCKEELREHWLYQCRKLPSRLTSVEFVMPDRLKYTYQWWMYSTMCEEQATLRDVAEVLRVFCMEVVRTVPRASISYSGQPVIDRMKSFGTTDLVWYSSQPYGTTVVWRDNISQEERDILDAMLREVESWREFLCAWLDAWNA